MPQEKHNNPWKDATSKNVLDCIKKVSKQIKESSRHIHPTAIFLRVPAGITDIKVFQPISGEHPALIKHNLTGEWYPVALYGARGKDADGNDTFGPLCSLDRQSFKSIPSVKESCYRITFYPHPFERIWPDWNGGSRRAIDVYVPANQKEYCGLDLSDVIKIEDME